jgi:hypothetical protein
MKRYERKFNETNKDVIIKYIKKNWAIMEVSKDEFINILHKNFSSVSIPELTNIFNKYILQAWKDFDKILKNK